MPSRIQCPYVELHARSAFSFLRGSDQPETLVARAAAVGMPALAVTDRDGVYGSARVHHACREIAGGSVRGIVGAEVTLDDGCVIPVLVESRAGYQNLCQLLTKGKLRAPKGEGSVTWSELGQAAGGLVALSGDEEGPVRRALARGDCEGAAAALRRLVAHFGKANVYVELQRHRVRGEGWANRQLVELAHALGLPLLATGGTCYAGREGRLLADAFTCLREHVTLDGAGTLLARNGQRYLKSPAEMWALFGDLPAALHNTVRLAERLPFGLEDLGYAFPDYRCPHGRTMAEALRGETYAGARYRYGTLTRRVRDQLDHELALIERLGFCGYFLIVWELVNAARDMGVLVQGRGSAANSAVCYSLGITACDPLAHHLLFERFLSDGRHSWPDIDLDLPSGDRREAVIQHVYQKYAPRGAAMTANVITYRGRSALREMAKVLGIPESVSGRFSDLYASGDFPHTLELREQVTQAGLPADHPRLHALVRLYQMVYGLPRHLGQHSGGMVISDKPLDLVVPLENASMPGRVVLQWDKEDCADLGIVKVDLLGLGMMAAIQDTIELCARRPGRQFDLAKLPTDDEKTFDMMCAADTVGVFQIESRAQMATLPRMKPRCFYDVVIEVALIRPGPIVGDLVHPYLDRRDGRQPIDHIHPLFEPVLARTLGVPLFQEQVLKMAMLIADFSGSDAEELRRAMSFGRSEERMQKAMVKLRAAMAERGVAEAVQDKVVGSICSFALYGFPESHAISFGLLAYASVWMKAHRAVEFYAALLNNQPMGFYSPATLVKDAKRHGIRVRPVCVLASQPECRVDDDRTLRLGLRLVKGLSSSTAGRVMAARAERPFAGLEDFLLRARPNKGERRVLAKIGALNNLPGIRHRRDALWDAEQAVADDLFEYGRAQAGERESASTLPAMHPGERLRADYEGLHLTTGPHPMAFLRERLPDAWRAADLVQAKHNQRVLIAGMVICRQRPGTAKGHVFVSLEDETGIANAFVPSSTFERNRLTITQEPFLKIWGRLQHVDNVISVYALKVDALASPDAVAPKSHDFR